MLHCIELHFIELNDDEEYGNDEEEYGNEEGEYGNYYEDYGNNDYDGINIYYCAERINHIHTEIRTLSGSRVTQATNVGLKRINVFSPFFMIFSRFLIFL